MGARGSDSAETCIVETSVTGDEPVSLAVVRAVAAIEDVPAAELPPLYESIDPDALCELLEDGGFDGEITFSYDGYEVLVTSAVSVEVHDADGD